MHTNYARLSRNEDDLPSMPRGASAWHDDHPLSDEDFEAPCPFIAEHCPWPCCCCCALSRSHRQQCALTLLYAKGYLVIYVLIIAMTLTLLIYDLANGHIIHDLKSEPFWFIMVDISCVSLMVIDVVVQMQAHSSSYWKSAMNVFDFVVVLLCVISIPIYFYVPDSDFILTVVLLLRFAAQLLRIVMVYKHHENRSAYMETTREDLVDFTGYDENTNHMDRSSIIKDSSMQTTYQNAAITPSLTKSGLIQNNTYEAPSSMASNYNSHWDD